MSQKKVSLGGWIVFYCVTLVLGGLILVLAGVSLMNLGEYKELIIIGLIFFIFGAIKFYQLYRLIYVRNKTTVSIVKALLIVDLVLYAIVLLGLLLDDGSEIGSYFVMFVVSALWLAYFMRSKRVNEIYQDAPQLVNNRDY